MTHCCRCGEKSDTMWCRECAAVVTQDEKDEERYRLSVEIGIYNDWYWEE